MKKSYTIFFSFFVVVLIVVTLFGQQQWNSAQEQNSDFLLPTRESAIPHNAIKITPELDSNPPKSLSTQYFDPVPVEGSVNTAGAEDSAFIIANGSTLYFFFTPDMSVPVEKQVMDPTVGIYVSHKIDEVWSEPKRVLLQDPEKLALDGCEVIQGNTMYFCSAREGYTGLQWFKATYIDGKWQSWENIDDLLKTSQYDVGELYITKDYDELFFHSNRAGGREGLDIWFCQNINGRWSEPQNVQIINSPSDEGWPTLSPDGNELWFSKDYAVWRSLKINGEWQNPEKMFSPLAGEPSVDNSGNVYFTHHFFVNDTIVSADIYVAYKK